MHSEVLRFRPIDGEVAQRPQQARENLAQGTSESTLFLQNKAIPEIITKGEQICGLPPATVVEHIPQVSRRDSTRKVDFLSSKTFNPFDC